MAAESWLLPIAAAIQLVVLLIGATLATFYFVLLAVAATDRLRRLPARSVAALKEAYWQRVPSVSIIVPARNETLNIVDCVLGLMATEYPRLEVIVVNDGSTDDTLDRLKHAFNLSQSNLPYKASLDHRKIHATYASTEPVRLLVLDKEKAGKSDALNAGINFSPAANCCVR